MDGAGEIPVQPMHSPGADGGGATSTSNSPEEFSVLVRTLHYILRSVWIGPPTVDQTRTFIHLCVSVAIVLVSLLVVQKVAHVRISLRIERESDENAKHGDDKDDAGRNSDVTKKTLQKHNSMAKPEGYEKRQLKKNLKNISGI